MLSCCSVTLVNVRTLANCCVWNYTPAKTAKVRGISVRIVMLTYSWVCLQHGDMVLCSIQRRHCTSCIGIRNTHTHTHRFTHTATGKNQVNLPLRYEKQIRSFLLSFWRGGRTVLLCKLHSQRQVTNPNKLWTHPSSPTCIATYSYYGSGFCFSQHR